MTAKEEPVYDSELSNPNPGNPTCVPCRAIGRIPARLVLYLLSFSGFMVSFIMRCDINITILAMVKDSKKLDLTNSSEQQCYLENDQANSTDQIVDYGGTLEWSSDVQGHILTAFFWSYIVTQILGGEITQKFGTKRVFGYAQLVTAMCSFCIPWASEIHYSVVILLRLIQGFFSGFTWPAMYSLIGHWIPVQERTVFISSFQGFNIGTGLSYVLCGYIIANFGWKYVFYTTGSLGLTWCIIWYFLAFDSPETHPRISSSEKEYIRQNADTTYAVRRQYRTPWMSILRSAPVWVISITSFGRVWVLYTFKIYGPQYMKTILGFNPEKNGVLSGLPFLLSYVSTLIFSFIADKIITYRLLSMTSTRKLLTGLSQIVPGLLCVLIGYLGCNITAILVVWFFAVTLLPAAFAGAMANIADIAPNFGGPILGLAQTVMMPASILSPFTVGYFTKDGHTLDAWRKVFNISGFVSIATFVTYQIWGTAEIQSWNYRDGSVQPNENRFMLEEIKKELSKDEMNKNSAEDDRKLLRSK